MAVRIRSRDDVEKWLKGRPREDAVALAARAAARVLPLVVEAVSGASPLGPRRFADLILATLRACALARVAATYPTRANEMRAPATYGPADVAYADAPAYLYAYAAARAAATAADNDDAPVYAAAAAARAANAAADDDDARAGADAAAAAAWSEVEADARVLERRGAAALVAKPLWSRGAPVWAAEAWTRLQAALRPQDRWAPWIEWYEAVLAGRPLWPELNAAAREALEVSICLIDEDLWAEGAATVNAEIERLIGEALPARIAAQGPGPHFGLDAQDLIEPAAHFEYDADGNIPPRIRSLLPSTRRAAADLAAALRNDPYQLKRDAEDYLAAIAPEPDRIDWGTVYGLGLFIENAAAAAEREIADRMVPPLEDPAQKALETLRPLSLNLIMASGEGRKLMEQADALRLTRDAQRELGADARTVASRLADARKVATPAAAARLDRAAEAVGLGPFAERGTEFGLAAVGNIAVVLLSAATLASLVTAATTAGALMAGAPLGVVAGAAAAGPAWLGYESLKKSKKFAEATAALGGKFDELTNSGGEAIYRQLVALAPFRAFVRANELELRRIAQKSARMRWALRYIDFIVSSASERKP